MPDLRWLDKRIDWFHAGSAVDALPFSLLRPGQMTTRVLKDIKGFDAPAYSFDTSSTPGVDGVSFGPVRATRSLVVPVLMRAKSRAHMRELKSELVQVMNPKLGPGRLVMSEDIGSDSGASRFAYAIYRDGLTGDGTQGGLADWWRFDLQFECTDPYWYSTDPLVASWAGVPSSRPFFPFTFPFALSGDGVYEVEVLDVRGDADSWPSFDLRGPFNRIRVAPSDGSVATFWEVQRRTSGTEMLRLVTKPGEESLRLFTTPDGGATWVDAGNAWSVLHNDSWFTPLRFRDQLTLSGEGTTRDTLVTLTALEGWNTAP